MLTKDLDGHQKKWLLHHTNNRGERSSYHIATRQLLKEIYPTLQILEEVPIHPRHGLTLYLDFYIPVLLKAIETHGEQHYKFVPHFHQTQAGFVQYRKNESIKRSWCNLNRIALVELAFNEDKDEWLRKIKSI